MPSVLLSPEGGDTSISIIMSQKLQLPKRDHGGNAPSATSPAPRRTTSGPSSIPCWTDRKSTRLNSSHLGISYAVFCLKKKKKTITMRVVWENKTGMLWVT